MANNQAKPVRKERLTMTYAENYELLMLAKNGRAESVTIELDPGELRLPVEEALGTFNRLSPGEYFQVISINF